MRAQRPPADAGVDCDQIDWHELVDYVCIGPGDAALAFAVAAEGAGFDVYLAGRKPASDDETLAGRLGLTDPDSVGFLAEVTADSGPHAVGPAVLPAHVSTDRSAAPFDFRGSGLRDWATACISSPYGLLFTTPAGPDPTPMPVGACDAVNAGAWLAGLAEDAGIMPDAGNSLEELVFVDGRVVGAVIDTGSQRREVGAVQGVVIATDDSAGLPLLSEGQLACGAAEIVVVTRAVSRFARLEVLVDQHRRSGNSR